MDNQTHALQALSMDLLRVAMGRHRGQTAMAARFTLEAKKRLAEVPDFEFHTQITQALNSSAERSAEDLLMYSTLVRNRSTI
jgi:hypothetical protein